MCGRCKWTPWKNYTARMLKLLIKKILYTIIIILTYLNKLHIKINKTAFSTGRGLLNKISFLKVHIADFIKIKFWKFYANKMLILTFLLYKI